LVIHDHTSINPWSFEFEAAHGYADKVLCVCVFTKQWSVRVTLVYIR